MTDSKYVCPHCAEPLDIPSNSLRQTLECPSCKGQLTNPKLTPDFAQVAAPASPRPTWTAHPEGSCPLCGQTKHMHKAKALYGHMICTKCYYGFASRRQAAFFLDSTLWWCVVFNIATFFIVAIMTVGASESEVESASTWILSLLFFAIFCFKDGFGGHSLGKFICGVKVIDEGNGEPIGIAASFKRNIPLAIPFMPLIVCFELHKGHRTGDGWSRSKVIWKKYADHPIFAPTRPTAKQSQTEVEASGREATARIPPGPPSHGFPQAIPVYQQTGVESRSGDDGRGDSAGQSHLLARYKQLPPSELLALWETGALNEKAARLIKEELERRGISISDPGSVKGVGNFDI